MKVLALTRYGRLGSSSRLRFYQFVPSLEARGIAVTVAALSSDAYLTRLYHGRRPGPLFIGAEYAASRAAAAPPLVRPGLAGEGGIPGGPSPDRAVVAADRRALRRGLRRRHLSQVRPERESPLPSPVASQDRRRHAARPTRGRRKRVSRPTRANGGGRAGRSPPHRGRSCALPCPSPGLRVAALWSGGWGRRSRRTT
jgi:hypothetical protein